MSTALLFLSFFFFFNDTATTEIYTLSLHDALPILKHPDTPCGLKTDAERARHVRHRVREMLNSRGEWELVPPTTEKPLREIMILIRPNPCPLPQEREKHSLSSEESSSAISVMRTGFPRAPHSLSPLPGGEGQGE